MIQKIMEGDRQAATLSIHNTEKRVAGGVCLYAIDGYTHKEITGQLNISEGTSKWSHGERL